MQLYGGDGMRVFTSDDRLELGLLTALAEETMRLDLERMETQARLIRNEIAEMMSR